MVGIALSMNLHGHSDTYGLGTDTFTIICIKEQPYGYLTPLLMVGGWSPSPKHNTWEGEQ